MLSMMSHDDSFSTHQSDPNSSSARLNDRACQQAFSSQLDPTPHARTSSSSSDQLGSILSGKAGYGDALDRPAVAAKAFVHTTPGSLVAAEDDESLSVGLRYPNGTMAKSTFPTSPARPPNPAQPRASPRTQPKLPPSSMANRMLASPAADSQPSYAGQGPHTRNRTRSRPSPVSVPLALASQVVPVPAAVLPPDLPASPTPKIQALAADGTNGIGRVLLVTESPPRTATIHPESRKQVEEPDENEEDEDENGTVPGTSSGEDRDDDDEVEGGSAEEQSEDGDAEEADVKEKRERSGVDTHEGDKEATPELLDGQPSSPAAQPRILVQASANTPPGPIGNLNKRGLDPPIALRTRSPNTPQRGRLTKARASPSTKPDRRPSTTSSHDTSIDADTEQDSENDSMLGTEERKQIKMRKAQRSMQGQFENIAAARDGVSKRGVKGGDQGKGVDKRGKTQAREEMHVDDTDMVPETSSPAENDQEEMDQPSLDLARNIGTPDAESTPFAAVSGNDTETSDDEDSNPHQQAPFIPPALALDTAFLRTRRSAEPASATGGSSKLATLPARRKLGKTPRPIASRSFSPNMETPPDGHMLPFDERDPDAEPEATYTGDQAKVASTAQGDELDGTQRSEAGVEVATIEAEAQEGEQILASKAPAKRGRKSKAVVPDTAPRDITPDHQTHESLPQKTTPRSNQKTYGKSSLGSGGGRVRKPSAKVSVASSPLSGSSSSEPEDEEDSTWRPKAGPSNPNKPKPMEGDKKAKGKAKTVSAPASTADERSETPAPSRQRGKKRASAVVSEQPQPKRRKSRAAAESDEDNDMLDVIDQPDDAIMSDLHNVEDDGPLGSRVFAYWTTDQSYYPGRIASIGLKATVNFDDGSHSDKVPLDKIYHCRLLTGDIVGRVDMGKGNGDPQWMVIKLPPGRSDLAITDKISLKRMDDPKQTSSTLVKHLRIKKKDVKQLNDRRMAIDDTTNGSDRFDLRAPSIAASLDIPLAITNRKKAAAAPTASAIAPSPTATSSTTAERRPVRPLISPRKKSSVAGTALKGYGFMLSNMDNTGPSMETRKERINRQGGIVKDDVWDYYVKPDDCANGHDGFRLKDKYKELRGLFVLVQSGSPVMTPKVMMALAIGIPLISYQFVADAIVQTVPWQSYLLAAGRSEYIGNYVSQIISPGWGDGAHPMLESLDHSSARRPFWDCDVSIVMTPDVHDIIPFCASVMGAKSVITVKQFPDVEDLDDHDFVIVGDAQEANLPDKLRNNPKIVNVEYMKQCLIVGRALPKKCYKKPAASHGTPTKGKAGR